VLIGFQTTLPWSPDLAAWLKILAGYIVFLDKTLYSEIASLYPGG